MASNIVTISNWNSGGMADSKWSGIADSLYRMVGVDPHTEAGVLKAEQKLTKNSGTTVDEFCKWQIVSSNGRTYHFSADSGKIWERQSDGTWTLVYTTFDSRDYLLTSASIGIGTTPQNVATEAFTFRVNGTDYSKAAVAAGTALAGDDIPQDKYGAWALDIGSDETIDITAATANATGYATEVLAVAGLPAVAANHVRIGYVVVISDTGVFDAGTTSLASADVIATYTDSAAVTLGEAKCLGAIEYGGYIIWATESRVHRVLATDGEGAAEWEANVAENWQTFGIGNKEWHPMIEQQLNLYIGDGYYLALFDSDDAWTQNALDIRQPMVIKSLGKLSTDILIGTYIDDNITKTEIWRWNGWSVDATSSDSIDEVGVNAFIPADNFVYVSAGQSGNIYTYDGQKLDLHKKVQGTYSPTALATVHPDASANLDGNALFGVSNNTGNPCLEGVYRLGRHSKNYNWIMDMPYPISERSGSAFVTSGIEIGSIITLGQKILVSWKNSSTYGVDLLDSANKLSGAYIESRIMRPDRLNNSTFSKFSMPYNSLPASTAITLTYDKNYAGSYTTPTSSQVTDVDRKIITLEEGIEANTLQLKVVFTTSSNTTPSLESVSAFLT